MILVKQVNKSYGRKDNRYKVLDDISFTLTKERSVAIVGRSGSGKSTLMHVLSGLDTPDSGSILLHGTDVTALKPRARDSFRNSKIGFIFQTFFLHESSTVLENVMLPLEIAGVPYSLRCERSLTVLEQVSLAEKAKSRAKDLSGGQKQRVCIARALVTNPQIIFADEPTGNLDSENGKKVFDLLLDSCHSQQKMLFVVTHDNELATACDTQIRIADGRILSIDN